MDMTEAMRPPKRDSSVLPLRDETEWKGKAADVVVITDYTVKFVNLRKLRRALVFLRLLVQ